MCIVSTVGKTYKTAQRLSVIKYNMCVCDDEKTRKAGLIQASFCVKFKDSSRTVSTGVYCINSGENL